MRNLKRALSLTLASVMLLGMMVVGGNAAAGYDDVKETDNVEAIEVLQAVEVMVGDERGFGPDRPVSRAEMAVVMGKLLNLDYNYYASTCPFTDVSGNYDWARGWVGACAANGIVSGRGNGVYDPAATVTAVEAASMMMRALGYFQYAEDYNGGFQLATVKQGSEIGIFNGVGSDGNTAMTRNQVAQMALNALRSEMVTFTGTPGIEVNGVKIGYKAEYSPRTGTERKYNTIANLTTTLGRDESRYYIQLGEQLYDGKLKLDDDAYDVFGRPSRDWEYDGKGIGTYAKTELLDKEYVGKVTGKDLYDELGSTAVDKYDVYCYVDGVYTDGAGAEAALRNETANNYKNGTYGYYFNADDMNKNNKAAVGGTGTGTITEVYVDHVKDEVNVVVVNTYLAIANKDYDTKKESVNIDTYAIRYDTGIGQYIKVTQDTAASRPFTLDSDDFTGLEGIKKDDALLVTVADGDVQTIQSAEVLSGVTISAFKLHDKVVSGGTTYNYTTTAGYKNADDINQTWTTSGIDNLKDRTYNIYLDTFGNLIGIKEIEAKKNYVFITAIDVTDSNLINSTAKAKAIFLDGTVATINVNLGKSEPQTFWYTDNNEATYGYDKNAILNSWFTYSKSGDVYTVKQVPYTAPSGSSKQAQGWEEGPKTIDAKNYRLTGNTGVSDYRWVYGDADSVYLVAELGELTNRNHTWGVVKDVESVTTGIANADMSAWDLATAVGKADDTKTTVAPSAPTTSNGVYTLYNSDKIVIAAVVVGENNGSAKDLVYVTSSTMSLEEDNDKGSSTRADNDGLWTWSREVVRNGELVTLYEVGDDSSETYHLRQMQQYHWYQVRSDANGYVIDAKPVSVALTQWPAVGSSVYVTEYAEINDAVEQSGVDTVLYQTAGGPNSSATNGFGAGNKLVVRGNQTLAVTGQVGSGIHYNKDTVNVVLQYYNRNTKETDVMSGQGESDLKAMVDIVNDYSETRGNSTYYVSALIEKGFATSIVIYDSYNNYVRPDGGKPAGDGALKLEADSNSKDTWTLTVETKSDDPVQIADWLAAKGCTDITRTGITWSFTYGGHRYTGQYVNVVEDSKTTTISSVTVTLDPATGIKVGDPVTVSASAPGGVKFVPQTGTAEAENTWAYTLNAPTGYVFASTVTETNGYAVTRDSDSKITVTVTFTAEPKDPGTDVTPILADSAKGDKTAEAVTAKAADGKVTVAGLPESGILMAIIVKDGAEVDSITANGAMDWPADAELWILKGTSKPGFDENGLLTDNITFDKTEAGVAGDTGRRARAAEGNARYTFTKRYKSWRSMSVNGEVFPVEEVEIKLADGTVQGGRYKLLKKDVAAANAALDKKPVNPDMDWVTYTAETVPVELPDSDEVLEVPVTNEAGELKTVVVVEYTAGTDAEDAVLTITADPDAEKTYEIGGVEITDKPYTPDKGGSVEVKDDTPILPEATDSIQVIKNADTGKYELYTHKASVESVSEEELYSAIIAAAKKDLGATYANAEGTVNDLTKGQYIVVWNNMGDNAPNWTCNMVTTGEGTLTNPKDLFVVSVNGTAGKYVVSGADATLTGITGTKYLIPDTMPVAVAKADYAVSASGELTVAGVKADMNYVPAVWMLGIANNDSSTQVKAGIDGSTTEPTALAADATSGWMIPKTGCTVKFAFEEAAATATKGQKVDLKANDKVIATAAVEDEAKGATFTIEAAKIVAEADKNDKIVMTRKAQENSEVQKVLVDGAEVTFDAKNAVIVLDETKYHEDEGFIAVTMEANPNTGLDSEKLFGAQDAMGDLFIAAEKDDGTKGHDGKLICDVASVLGEVDSTGTLKLVAVSEVTLGTTDGNMKSMTLTVDGEAQDAIEADESEVVYYVKKGSTVTVVGADETAGFVVCTKDTSDPDSTADPVVTLLGTFKAATAATAKDVKLDTDIVAFTYQLAAEATNEVKVTAEGTVADIAVGMGTAFDEITVGTQTKDCAVYVWNADTKTWDPCKNDDEIAAGNYKIVLSNVKLSEDDQDTLILSSGEAGLTELAGESTEGLTLAVTSVGKSTVTFDQEKKTYALELYVTLAAGEVVEKTTPTLEGTTGMTVASQETKTITVTSDTNFDAEAGVVKGNWTVDVGETGLTFDSVTVSEKTATLTFTGNAATGDVKIIAKAEAFGASANVNNSAEATVNIPTE